MRERERERERANEKERERERERMREREAKSGRGRQEYERPDHLPRIFVRPRVPCIKPARWWRVGRLGAAQGQKH